MKGALGRSFPVVTEPELFKVETIYLLALPFHLKGSGGKGEEN